MFKIVKWTLLLSIIYSSQAFALSNNYYSKILQDPTTQADSIAFRLALFENLAYFHIPQPNHQPDKINRNCPRFAKCFKHSPLHYSDARIELLGNIHLEKNNDEFFIQTLYCRKKMSESDFGANRGPAPGRIPDHNILNTEHMWPQSRFSRKFPKRFQKSDLHALYPSESKKNSKRGNLPFAEVNHVEADLCPNAKLGSTDAGNGTYVEPPTDVRGDIARALFYFSVRYQIQIDPVQEEFFRKWHTEDPVSDKEKQKNDMVFEAQSNRNPFIDNPEWVKLINDF